MRTREDADERLREIFDHTASEYAVPLFHRKHLLGVILLGCRGPDRQCRLADELMDFLTRQLPVVLDRIRIYRGVWHSKEQAHSERLLAMRSLSASIAHEMRTPLSGIRASLSGVENYLPVLIEAYEAVKEVDSDFTIIRPQHLESLRNTPARISLMIDQANAVIDLLLMNLRENDESVREPCQAAACIQQAIDRYPFKPGERKRVHLQLDADFSFMGVEILFIYVIFNLVKNGLYAIRSAQKGDITIRLQRGDEFNSVMLEDTGTGIPEAVQERIFESFFTTKEEGTGAGLTFCRRTMGQFGGDITCVSELGAYTRFTLRLPVNQR